MTLNWSARLATPLLSGVLVLGCSSESAGPGTTPPAQAVATAIQLVSGNGQFGDLRAALPSPIVVKVVDQNGVGVRDIPVAFAVTAGGGSVRNSLANTDGLGEARTSWTLGQTAGRSVNVATATVAGLSGSPITFSASGVTGPAAKLVVVSGDNQSAPRHTTLPAPLVVSAQDQYGNPVGGERVSWAIASGGGTVSSRTSITSITGEASVSLSLGLLVGTQVTTASLTGSTPKTATFSSTATLILSPYNITLRFLSSMTSDQELVFEAAAERWRTVIVGDLPDVNATGIAAGACGSGSPAVNETIDDLLIFVTLESIDGPLGILGSAAPCFIRSSTRFTLIGRIRIDLDDVPLLESRGILEAVIQHEFGHVIGIGPLWTQPPSLLSGSVASGGSDPYFTGAGAIQEFDAKGGALYAGQRVPVENVGGGGTADAHWREAVMGRELMTGFLSWTSNPLSSITIASLGDMGYSVSYTYADEYTVNPANLRLGGILDGFYLKEAVPDWSLKEIDRRGRTTTLSQYPSANH